MNSYWKPHKNLLAQYYTNEINYIFSIMHYKNTTQVSNHIFDQLLPELNFSELKLLLLIIRQTMGWITKSGHRKQRDRINYAWFEKRSGLSRRVISTSIQSLISKQLIEVTDYHYNILNSPVLRKGKVGIYYAPILQSSAELQPKRCRVRQNDMQNIAYNKTNISKPNSKRTWLHTEKQNIRDNPKIRWTDKQRLQQILSGHKN